MLYFRCSSGSGGDDGRVKGKEKRKKKEKMWTEKTD